MANEIKLKRGSGSDPSASDLSVGEIAIRTDNGKLFTKKDNGNVAEISGSGGGIDDGDKGDITVSGGGDTWTIDNGAISTAKIADQAVDLTKLPHGTTSNDGKFLRANNGADPTFETISQYVANNVIGLHDQSSSKVQRLLASTEGVTVQGTSAAVSKLMFRDRTTANFLKFKPVDTLSDDVEFTLPSADGSSGTALVTNGNGVLSFSGPFMPLSGGTFVDDVIFAGTNYNATWDKSANIFRFNDDAKIALGTGTGNDMEIFHESSTNVNEIRAIDGEIHIQADNFMLISDDTAGRAIYLDNSSGHLELGFDGNHCVHINGNQTEFVKDVKFDGSTAGRDITFDRANNFLDFADDVKARFGTGGDLEIFHSPENSFITESGSGNLKIQASDLILADVDGTEYFHGQNNAGVDLKHNGNTKLQTTSSGVSVTGNITASGDATFNGGDVTISSTAPRLFLTDTNNNSDFRIAVEGGNFLIEDTSNSNADRFVIDSSGDITAGGSITASGGFSGSGASLTSLNADNISSGTLAQARIENSAINSDKLANSAVTFSKFQDISQNYILGRSSSGTGQVQQLSASTIRSILNVEDGATADQSASEILSLLLTVDGAGSGLDADRLDGITSADFVRSDTSDNLTGATYTFNSSTDEKIILSGTNNPYIRWRQGTTDKAFVQWNDHYGALRLGNTEDGSELLVSDGLAFSQDGSTFYSVWHAGNDGSGSGLDADKVDGIQAADFVRSDIEDTIAAPLIISAGTANSTNDASLLVTATNNNDWAIKVDKNNSSATDYGIQVSISSSGNYAYRATDGSNEVFRVQGNGKIVSRDILISSDYHLQRSNHHSGHLEGSYNNVGGNAAKSNPIYTIGSSYNPVDASLSNMYGIGFCQGSSANFVSSNGGWGMYAAADGNARIFLDAQNGRAFIGENDRYITNYVSGDYGSFQINGSGANGYEGFSIDGRYVLMHDGGVNGGLYNDVDNEWYVYTERNGRVILYNNGADKLTTTSTGIDVNGRIDINDSNTRIEEGSSNALRIQTNSGHCDIGPMNTSYMHFQTDRGIFYFNKKLQINGNCEPYGSHDLGASGNRWQNLYVNDLQLSNESSGGNSVDGTWGDWTLQEGEDTIFMLNNRNGKKYKMNLTEVS